MQSLLILLGCICTNRITDLDLLSLACDSWCTEQGTEKLVFSFYFHFNQEALQPSKWTTKQSRFILSNLKAFNFHMPDRIRASPLCVVEKRDRYSQCWFDLNWISPQLFILSFAAWRKCPGQADVSVRCLKLFKPGVRVNLFMTKYYEIIKMIIPIRFLLGWDTLQMAPWCDAFVCSSETSAVWVSVRQRERGFAMTNSWFSWCFPLDLILLFQFFWCS